MVLRLILLPSFHCCSLYLFYSTMYLFYSNHIVKKKTMKVPDENNCNFLYPCTKLMDFSLILEKEKLSLCLLFIRDLWRYKTKFPKLVNVLLWLEVESFSWQLFVVFIPTTIATIKHSDTDFEKPNLLKMCKLCNKSPQEIKWF